jgi:hypothetical protein
MRMEFDQIVRVVRQRIQERTPLLMQLLEVKRRYNGDYVIPLPELDNEPVMPPSTLAVIANAVDNLGRRAASVMTYDHFPAIKTGKLYEQHAHNRRRAWSATLYESQFALAHQRAMRHLAGYSTCAMRVVCDWDKQMPRIVCEDPLSTFPEPRKPEDPRPPSNCAFLYEMPAGLIRSTWPASRKENGGPISPYPDGYTEAWTMVEWVDDNDTVIGIVGPKFPLAQYRSYDPRSGDIPWLELSRAPQLAGRCPVIVPGKIGLAEIASQVANAVGMSDLMSKMMALAIAAEEKAIYPDLYAIGVQNGNPMIVGGSWKDGRTGEMNLVQDVTAVGQLRSDVSPMALQLVSLLERNFNASTGSNPAMQGESYGALRTGRAIDSIVGAQVDPLVLEMHQIVETYLPFLCDIAFSTYEGAWGNKQYTLFSGWPGDRGMVDFTPNVELKESHQMVASYAIAGTDVQQATIGLGQLRATKAISLKTFRERHPWVGDAESEEHQTLLEDLQQATMAGIVNGLAAPAGTPGSLDPMIGELIYRYIANGEDPMAALTHAHQEAQKLQAQAAPPAPPGMVGPPAGMPGIGGPAQPGLGAGIVPQGPESTNLGPNQDQNDIRGLVRALGTVPPAAARQPVPG